MKSVRSHICNKVTDKLCSQASTQVKFYVSKNLWNQTRQHLSTQVRMQVRVFTRLELIMQIKKI
jgi:hypothetical protein